MLEYLARLSRLSTRRRPTPADVGEACALVCEALGAEEAYLIFAGDPYFKRLGVEGDPTEYEIKQRGYWLVWKQLAGEESHSAVSFTVAERFVTQVSPLTAASSGTHVACLLPADESNSEMLVLRGLWPQGLGEQRCSFLEAARPIVTLIASRILDSTRQARQQQQLRALADVALVFNNASSVDTVLKAVCTAMAKASRFDWALVVVTSEDGGVVLDSALNLARHSNTTTAKMRAPYGPELVQQLLERRGPQLRPNVFDPACGAAADELAYFERAHILSTASFPMFFQDKLMGFIRLSDSVQHQFDEAEVNILSDLVSQAATTIKGVRLYQELEEASRIQHFLARTDALTGIPNRRYIEEVLRAECARAQRYSEPVSVVMADLDYFKLVNDTYGHDAGDEALKHVAGIARESCRESDFVGRWGGDEFMFILPVTPLDGGIAFAERFRSSLSHSIFVPRDGRDPWKIGLSAGVAEASVALYPKPDSLFQLADAALYRAKESGRNRVLAAAIRAAAA